jgi:hypothetical protein
MKSSSLAGVPRPGRPPAIMIEITIAAGLYVSQQRLGGKANSGV